MRAPTEYTNIIIHQQDKHHHNVTNTTVTPLDAELLRTRMNHFNSSCFGVGWPGFNHGNSTITTGSNASNMDTTVNNNISTFSSDERIELSSRLILQKKDSSQHSANTANTIDTTKEEVDMFLASSMAELSFKDRQKYQEDLHGVATNKPEDSEQIAGWMKEMQTYLDDNKSSSSSSSNISNNNYSAYQTAETMDSSYVQDYKFRLMFLRGNRYKPKEAAQQILAFFEMKQRLFGVEKLTKQITLDDLTEDDKQVLKTGNVRLLPCYDSAGRTILLGLPGLLDVTKLENDLRARFYFFMTVLQNSERAQLYGVVVVSYAVGRYRDTTKGAGFLDQTKLSMALPIHFAGLHLCCDTHDQLQYILVSACLRMVPSELRARFRLHLGSPLECQYSLKAFGIRPEALECCVAVENNNNNDANNNNKNNNTGTTQQDYHMRWYKECEWQESIMAATSGSGDSATANTTAGAAGAGNNNNAAKLKMPIEAFPSDVLFGGKKNANGGNRRLRQLVRNYASQYDSSSKSQKRELVEQVIYEIQQTGGRFLDLGVVGRSAGASGESQSSASSSSSSEHWVELSAEEACTKVAQTFRNNRRPRVTQMNNNNNNTRNNLINNHAAKAKEVPSSRRRPSLENTMKPTTTTTTTASLPTSQTTTIQQGGKRIRRRLPGAPPPDQPTEYDVLFGRKRNNEGNKRVRQLVGELATEYDKASKTRKTQIADSVVQEIQRQGGRFMKQVVITTTTTTDNNNNNASNNRWEEVPDDFARNKISKHFRNNRRPPTTKWRVN